MTVSVTVVHGSPPCATVERALQLKGIPYTTLELLPPLHAAVQRVRTGVRTVPSIKLDGEKISGSLAIMRRIDAYVPSPPLYGTTDAERMRIEAAEQWGEEELQGVARRLLWPALSQSTDSVPSYQDGSKLPSLPRPVVTAVAPVIARIQLKLNKAGSETVKADLRALPGMLDQVDAWLADGTLGGDPPNAADLQIAPSLTLLMTLHDLDPMFAGRPCGPWAQGLNPGTPGSTPAGALPVEAPVSA